MLDAVRYEELWRKDARSFERATLHRWTQIAGKIRMRLVPFINHWWNVTLYVSERGLTTEMMPLPDGGGLAIEFEFAERVLRKADGLIAVSENTRRDAARLLGLDAARIEVIYSGVAAEYFEAAPLPSGKLGLSRPYILFVGTLEPRKNLSRLVRAYRRF